MLLNSSLSQDLVLCPIRYHAILIHAKSHIFKKLTGLNSHGGDPASGSTSGKISLHCLMVSPVENILSGFLADRGAWDQEHMGSTGTAIS